MSCGWPGGWPAGGQESYLLLFTTQITVISTFFKCYIVTPGLSVKKVLVAPALKLKAAPGEVWLQS